MTYFKNMSCLRNEQQSNNIKFNNYQLLLLLLALTFNIEFESKY